MKFKERYSRWCSQVEKIDTGLKQAYFKYYGQCEDKMKASLEEDPGFDTAHKAKDVLKLRVILRGLTFHFRTTEEPIKTLFKTTTDFLKFRQNRLDITTYYKKFTDLKNLMGEMVGDEEGCYNSNGLLEVICLEKKVEVNNVSNDDRKEYVSNAQNKIMAMHFILNADYDRYGKLIREYDRAYLGGGQ